MQRKYSDLKRREMRFSKSYQNFEYVKMEINTEQKPPVKKFSDGLIARDLSRYERFLVIWISD